MKNLWMLLALSLFSGHALADGTMGNGSGWCQPTSGTHNFFFPLDQTITDTDENQAGKIVKESWSVGANTAPGATAIIKIIRALTISPPRPAI